MTRRRSSGACGATLRRRYWNHARLRQVGAYRPRRRRLGLACAHCRVGCGTLTRRSRR
jgi:hypothetical protein